VARTLATFLYQTNQTINGKKQVRHCIIKVYTKGEDMIKLVNISKYYKSDTLVNVGIRKINLSFHTGEFIAITGESGSGKSTLLNILSGLDTFEEGEFFLYDEPTSHYTIEAWESYRAKYVGFVFQNYNIIDSYTVYQNVLMSLEFQGYDQKTRKDRALEIIERVGLSHRLHHRASKLSGGEKQRTVIARALAKDCQAILCDEPTGNLDSKTGEEIIGLLHEISKDKLVILVTHHFPEIEKYATRRIKMSDGEVIEDIQLKTVNKSKEVKEKLNEKHVNLKTTTHIALRNLFALPKKLVFMLMLQIFFVILAFLIYGTTNSLFHQNSLLPDAIDSSEHQIIIQRLDQQPISQIEVDAFLSSRYIRAVNDFETSTTLFQSIGRQRIFTERTQVLNQSDLYLGRWPLHIEEIVISEDLAIYLNASLLDTITLRTAMFEPYMFTVVGISSKISKSVYFHDDYFHDDEFLFKSIVNRVSIQIMDNHQGTTFTNVYRNYTINPLFTDDQVLAYITYDGQGTRSVDLKMATGYGQIFSTQVMAQLIPSESVSGIELSQVLYETLVEEMLDTNYRHKVVLSVYDRYDGTRFMQTIDQDIYIVYYEALVQNLDYSAFGYVLKVGAYLLIFVVGIFLLMLLRVVFKNMVQKRRKDFAIFRSIGASQKFLGRMIFIEQALHIIFGSLLTLIILIISVISIPSVQTSIRYITAIDMAVVFIVFSYMMIATPLKYNQSIFEISVIDTLTKSAEVNQ